MTVERGCLLIADVSGYTKYLGGVELDHAQEILAELLSEVVSTTSLLRMAKLEGDAVFCHAPAGTITGADLVATIEGCYFAFRRRLQTIDALSSCPCDACSRVPELDLKFVAHSGEYVLHEIAGQRELVGSDVIRVHRLAKNDVVERVGTAGYAFFTDAVVVAEDLGAFAEALLHHVEHHDGEDIAGRILNLSERWDQERERPAIKLTDADAGMVLRETLPVAPPAAWAVLTSPGLRPQWVKQSKRVDQENPRGVPGVGTINHCAHGLTTNHETILEWHPFDYFTISDRTPLGPATVTYDLEPLGDDRTQLTLRARAEGGRAQRLLLKFAGRRLAAETQHDLATLRCLLEAGSLTGRAATPNDAEQPQTDT